MVSASGVDVLQAALLLLPGGAWSAVMVYPYMDGIRSGLGVVALSSSFAVDASGILSPLSDLAQGTFYGKPKGLVACLRPSLCENILLVTLASKAFGS